jgi:hypothetical protein
MAMVRGRTIDKNCKDVLLIRWHEKQGQRETLSECWDLESGATRQTDLDNQEESSLRRHAYSCISVPQKVGSFQSPFPHRSASRACWVTTSHSRSLFQSRLAQGLRGSLRSSTDRHPSFFSTRSPGKSQGLDSTSAEDFHIITRDDFYPGVPPGNASELSRPRRRRRLRNTASQLRSSEANPRLRNRPSDISDLTACFPQPPSHIPLPVAWHQSNGTRSLLSPSLSPSYYCPRNTAVFSPLSRGLASTFAPSEQAQGPLPQARQKILQETAFPLCPPSLTTQSNLRAVR